MNHIMYTEKNLFRISHKLEFTLLVTIFSTLVAEYFGLLRFLVFTSILTSFFILLYLARPREVFLKGVEVIRRNDFFTADGR